jgi:uncharacterized membrane protein YdjX (TVP38/TMEM64 family)
MGRLTRHILEMDARAWRTALASFLLFGGVGLAFVLAASLVGFKGEATVEHWLGFAAHSPFALLVAVAAFAVLAFVGAPQVMLIAAAVVAFGPWLGSAYSWVGTMVSSSVGFWLGRLTGGRLLRRVPGEGVQRFIALVGRNGFLASLMIRLVPSAPFMVVNMAAGMTPMRFAAFLAGTAIGIVPKILLTAMAGQSLVHAGRNGPWVSLLILGLALAVWIGSGLIARNWIRRREAETEKDAEGS